MHQVLKVIYFASLEDKKEQYEDTNIYLQTKMWPDQCHIYSTLWSSLLMSRMWQINLEPKLWNATKNGALIQIGGTFTLFGIWNLCNYYSTRINQIFSQILHFLLHYIWHTALVPKPFYTFCLLKTCTFFMIFVNCDVSVVINWRLKWSLMGWANHHTS